MAGSAGQLIQIASLKNGGLPTREGKKALPTANGSSEMFQMANLVQVIEVPAYSAELTPTHSPYGIVGLDVILQVSSPTIQVANKAALKVQGIRGCLHPMPDLSTNLISAGLLEYQGYIHHDLQVDTGNYFEIIASIGNDIFYVNLNFNNIYVLSDTPSMFGGIMNDLELGPLAYLTVLKPRAISIDYDLNTASLGLSNHDDVEQLINLKDLDINTFILSPPI
ncbi:hypothetical protein ACO22_07341 [Paracoccidioides brasiliensis]|uniref:Uncharacterized protein n=1 Tax=Paracoccidioides brasiliensis TaxID=121759 RepID=A0A1D2J4V6_PARBR|nr:hypothetical protein ACO22_07341 [Paracoccidioides brasiliensis]